MRIGSVELDSPLLLAPISGHCDLPFRLVVREVSLKPTGRPVTNRSNLGLACTDLLCPQAIIKQSAKTSWLAATCPEDRPLCMQLYGAQADIMAEAARWAEAHGAAVIDINMGCPVDKVTKKNGGSKLLCNPSETVKLARQVVDAVRVPVTAKIRLGWDENSLIADTLPVALADIGVQAITVHGRTTEQKFRGRVRLEGITQVVEAMARRHPDIPVIGNGDVKCAQDARDMMTRTGCRGVMIGRGALGQPWIFRDAAHYLGTGRMPLALPRAQRARIALDHFDQLLRHRGERVAVSTIRQRMSWYSPHLQPWPGLRRHVRQINSSNQFLDFMASGIERIERGEEPPAPSAA